MFPLTPTLSSLALAGLVLILCATLGMAAYLLRRKFLADVAFSSEFGDVGGIFGGAIATIFALVFALVTIAVWQNYDKTSSEVGEEANCLHNIYRFLESYPPEVRDPIRQELRAYAQEVIRVEWLALRQGKQAEEAHRLITEVNKRISAYRPATLGELPLHNEVLRQISLYRGLRHDRIRAGGAYLDAPMWVAMYIGAFLLIGFCSLWRLPTASEQLLQVMALSLSIGVIFFLMLAYDNPFAGPSAIGPEPFEKLLKEHWLAQ